MWLKERQKIFIKSDQHIHHGDHHLGDVEDDGEEEGRQDVDGQVDRGGISPLQILIKIWRLLNGENK